MFSVSSCKIVSYIVTSATAMELTRREFGKKRRSYGNRNLDAKREKETSTICG